MKPGFTDSYTIQHASGTDTDDEGRTTLTYTDVPVAEGHVAMADFAEQARAGGTGVRYDAVALAPLGTAVAYPDRVVVAAHPQAFLVGTYEVAAVRTNPLHLRILMRRWEP